MTNEQFDLLLTLTSIRSADLIAALRSHFVDGLPQREAASLHEVHEGFLSRRVKAVREVEGTVIKLAKLYHKG